LYVCRDDQVVGLAHLVRLALRVRTLFEVLVRRGREESVKKLPGLIPGQANRTTERRTGSPVLTAIGRGDHGDEGGRWKETALAFEFSAGAGAWGAVLAGLTGGSIQSDSH
jgi:hypothetical protein